MDMDKTCTKCLELKPLSDFHKHCRKPDGHNSSCKLCKGKSDKKWRSTNRSAIHQYDVQRRYGMEHGEYQAKLKKQNGRCAICGQKCISGKRLSVDHSHQTGSVRGLLCSRCNTALGLMNDNVERLFEAIIYLNGNTNNGR